MPDESQAITTTKGTTTGNQVNVTTKGLGAMTINNLESRSDQTQTTLQSNSLGIEVIYKADRCCKGLAADSPDILEIKNLISILTTMDEQSNFKLQGDSMLRDKMYDRAVIYYLCALYLANNTCQIETAMIGISNAAKKLSTNGLSGNHLKDLIEACQQNDTDHKTYWNGYTSVHIAEYCYSNNAVALAHDTVTSAEYALEAAYPEEIKKHKVFCLLLILKAKSLHKEGHHDEAKEAIVKSDETWSLVENWKSPHQKKKCKDEIKELKDQPEYQAESIHA